VTALPLRLLTRESNTARPGRLRKSLAAWWVAGITLACPAVAVIALTILFEIFNLFDSSTEAVFTTFFGALASIAVAAALTRSLFAPDHPNWRLVGLDNRNSRHARRAIIGVVTLTALSHLIVALNRSIGADVVYQSAWQGISVFCVALAIIAALWRDPHADCDSDAILGPRVTTGRDWYGVIRVIIAIAAATVVIAVLAGFMGFASFLVDQINWIGFIILVAVMTFSLLEEAIAYGCRPATPLGRALINSIGLRNESLEQIAILLSGIVSVVIFISVVLLVLAPWGIQSSDLPTYLHSAFFGFRVGDITISLASIIVAVAILIAGSMATHTVESWLESRFLPHTRLDIGLRNAIKTSFGYFGFILALGFALAYLGLNFQKLAIVAGALSVGIGFGLQSIVNNFVSGLILLWERAIRVGDWIIVGKDEGIVRRINVRSTEIETFDRAAVVVPNSNLVIGVVKNFVRTDRSGRVQISMPVNPAADPEKARDVLLEIATNHSLVLKEPAPFVGFSAITPAAFNFDLFCYVADVSTLGSVKSELNFEIYRRFKAEGLFAAPLPQSVVNLPDFERFEPLLARVMAAAPHEGLGNGKETR
jgi:potassium-dependent mechanosensitive channel